MSAVVVKGSLGSTPKESLGTFNIVLSNYGPPKKNSPGKSIPIQGSLGSS